MENTNEGQQGNPYIVLENLSKWFGDVLAVDDFNLEIYRGEFVTLLGPSGSGKTTVLRMVAGFETPTSGQIYIDGHAMQDVPAEKRNSGMVFQSYTLFPHMTVAENIAFPLKMRGIPKEEMEAKVQDALNLIQLSTYGARLPRQLSGGQQQRVALARAVVFNPRVLLMDEPLGSLDKRLRDDMQLEIKRIQQEIGITVIYVTHDQSEALTMSERIVIMNMGVIQQIGSPDSLYERPTNQFVADFVGDTNLFKCRIEAIEGRTCRIRTDNDTSFLIPYNPDINVGSIIHLALRPEQILIAAEDAPSVPNSLKAIVEERIYFGGIIRYMVRFEGGDMAMVHQPNRIGRMKIDVGNSYQFYWELSAPEIIGVDQKNVVDG